jgi:hypothetical protein
MRRFYLKREEDVSGVSGTGRVADGVEFENGLCAVTWKSEYPSITVYQSVTVLEKVHTHKGKDKTKLVWVDPKFEELEVKAKETKDREREEMEAEEAAEEAALHEQEELAEELAIEIDDSDIEIE